MKKRSLRCWHPIVWLSFFLLLYFTTTLSAQSNWQDLAPAQVEFSLLTASPGNVVHNVFGHSGLRLKGGNIDVVFNWGTFNYRTDNFEVKFIRGLLPYHLSVNPYSRFARTYVRQNRGITEQVFDLNPEEKKSLFALLKNNMLEENLTYRYDFFYDNCSTRIRELLEKCSQQSIEYATIQSNISYRGLLQEYLEGFTWLQLGINLILGRKSNGAAGEVGRMFLPIEMENGFRSAQISGRPLVKKENELAKVGLFNETEFSWPSLVFGLLFLLSALLFFLKKNIPTKVHLLDKLLFSLVGLVGWFFLFMWLGTKHIATSANPHLLWAIPFYLPLIWVFPLEKLRKWIFYPALILFAIYILLLFLGTDVWSLPIIFLIGSIVLRMLHYTRKPKLV